MVPFYKKQNGFPFAAVISLSVVSLSVATILALITHKIGQLQLNKKNICI